MSARATPWTRRTPVWRSALIALSAALIVLLLAMTVEVKLALAAGCWRLRSRLVVET